MSQQSLRQRALAWRQPSPDPRQAFEDKVFAEYIAYEIPFPYIGASLVALTCAWLMYGRVPTLHIVIWFVSGGVLTLLRELFIWQMKPHLQAGRGHAEILWASALSCFLTGAAWGVFIWMYFDAADPLTLLMAGSVVAGTAGSAVTPTSVFLPAYYASVLPIVLPYALLLALVGTAEHYLLAGLTMAFLASASGYAHVTNRLHRSAVNLRYDNQHLIEDLAERRAAAEAASRTKSLFLAGVSHDLKQPIRAMGLYLGVLQQTQAARRAAALDQVAPKMEKALTELHSQVTRLLELSRLQSGALEVQPQQVDLQALFARLQSLFEAQARGQGIRLQFASLARRRHGEVWVDLRMLESILQNLISNALKHTASGAVYVGTRWRQEYPAGRQLCIEVRDSGRGIAPDQQALLFDAYRSFDDRQANESHGLGLAIAKAQAGYLNAGIELRSAPGAGSTFTLCGLTEREPSASGAQRG